MSVTVTVNEQVDVLPPVSVAIELTVVVPFGKVDPDGGVLTTLTPSQLSEVATVYVTTAEHRSVSEETEMFAGQLIDGAGLETVVVVVADRSFVSGSPVEELTVDSLVITAPSAAVQSTVATRVKVAVPGAKDEIVQVTVPVPPTEGVTQDHPAGALIDLKVVLAGMASATVTDAAGSGPPLVTVIV